MPESASLSTIGDATRFIKITYPGTGNSSQFTYDGRGRDAEITEIQGGSTTSTRQFVWSGNTRCEARTATGTVSNMYFDMGETISGTNYYFGADYLGSVTQITDNSGNVQSLFRYDAWGRMSQIQGSLVADFQYAGYFFHARSGLNLTRARVYNANLGRFMSRDPKPDDANLYKYVQNNPISFIDPSGLQSAGGSGGTKNGRINNNNDDDSTINNGVDTPPTTNDPCPVKHPCVPWDGRTFEDRRDGSAHSKNSNYVDQNGIYRDGKERRICNPRVPGDTHDTQTPPKPIPVA